MAEVTKEEVYRRHVSLPDVPADQDDEEIFSDGVTYGIQIVAQMLGVHPDDFSWDAATEEFEGDVRSIAGNMLTAAFGEDVDPAALRQQLAEEREKPWMASGIIAIGTLP